MNNELLLKQISRVIELLQQRKQLEQDETIISLLLSRYIEAQIILEESGDIKRINILGGVRAYLDAYSDYSNPMLMEMDKAEKQVKRFISVK